MKRRLIKPQEQKYLIQIGHMLCFLILLRTVKFAFLPSSVWTRYAWYLYYIPFIYIILFLLSAVLQIGKNTGRSQSINGLYAIAALLSAAVLTNDLHQTAFGLGELSRAESMGACEINQKDLEKALAVTHPTMTEIIKRLEKKKAVICTQSKVDARYKKINCADEYKNIHIELKKMDWEIFNKICAGIPEEDIQTFLKASEKMLENIEK